MRPAGQLGLDPRRSPVTEERRTEPLDRYPELYRAAYETFSVEARPNETRQELAGAVVESLTTSRVASSMWRVPIIVFWISWVSDRLATRPISISG